MEHIWLGLLILAVLVLCLYVPKRDHMTNKDLLATLDKFGKTGTKPKSSTDTTQEEIYGPKVPKTEEPSPTSASGKTDDDVNVYPDIYGPEITPVPGLKKSKSKSKSKSKILPSEHAGTQSGTQSGTHSSDTVEDDSYDFNPDFRKAFPVDDDEPQPFLTDFSKFQH